MLGLILFVLFVVVPIVEIFLILQVSDLIGGWQTVGLLIAEMIFGGWIVRREGRRAWQALNAALLRGVMPDRELADAALVLVGGTLLLTPGFLTDAIGFWFVLPPTRPVVRRLLAAYAARRLRAAQNQMGIPYGFAGRDGKAGQAGSAPGGERDGGGRDPGGADGGHQVIRGEVIDDDRDR
jgi:UPF0716 family protein affecting phage T7 exclusion